MRTRTVALVSLILLLGSAIGVSVPSPAAAIHNGTGTKASDAPWMVVFKLSRGVCSGVLIHRSYVLTAAHCPVYQGQYAILGRSNYNSTSTGWKTRIEATRVMPGYKTDTKKKMYLNDLRVVRLSSPAPSKYTPMPMATPSSPVKASHWAAGQDLRSFGYGAYGQASGGGLKTDGKLRNAVFRVNTTNTSGTGQLTATWSGRQLCAGDSGGPITKLVNGKRYLIGIHSTIYGNASKVCNGSSGAKAMVVAWRGSSARSPGYNWVRNCVWGTSCKWGLSGSMG